MENAIKKIYEQIEETGIVTDNQLTLIMLYEFGNKAINFLNKNFPKE